MKVLTVVGARPQFVKAAVVSKALAEAGIDEVLVHTGQHYDPGMSQVFFDELGIRAPDHHLGVGSLPQGAQTGRMLEGLEAILLEDAPDLVLVYGDTNSTLAGALAAAKLHIPIAHVEAGLRSFDRRMPEEVNRVVTDHVSDLLLCPSTVARRNLANEGITDGVHVVGDVMRDLLEARSRAVDHNAILAELGLHAGGYALATVHRAATTDDRDTLAGLLEALDTVAAEQLPVVLPLHPRTRAAMDRFGLSVSHVRLIDPVPYDNMLALLTHARLVLTDSGGVQKEAYWLGVPCVTLRDSTEWTETVDEGWNTLAGTLPKAIVHAAANAGPGKGDRDAYGRGEAGRGIAALLPDTINSSRM